MGDTGIAVPGIVFTRPGGTAMYSAPRLAPGDAYTRLAYSLDGTRYQVLMRDNPTPDQVEDVRAAAAGLGVEVKRHSGTIGRLSGGWVPL